MTTFIQTDIECPSGHRFEVRRRYSSAGYVVSTACPTCRKQFDVSVPNAKPPQKAAPRPKPEGTKLRERDIEARLVARTEELGGECRKVKWIGRSGAPDRLVMLPDIMDHEKQQAWDPRTIWVEVKAPGGAAKFPRNAHERAQQREHERMRKMGQRVVLVDSYEGIEEMLK